MTLTVVPAPTESTIRQHAGLDHGFAPDHIEQTTPALLLFEHDRAHDQFSAHKTPHRHHDNITADDLAGMSNGRLAGILEALPGDDLQALAAAEAARRIRLLDSFYAAYRIDPVETPAPPIAGDDVRLLAHAIAGELGGLEDPLASDEWQAVSRLAAALAVVLDVAPRPRIQGGTGATCSCGGPMLRQRPNDPASPVACPRCGNTPLDLVRRREPPID